MMVHVSYLFYPTFREVLTKLLLHFKHLLLYDLLPLQYKTNKLIHVLSYNIILQWQAWASGDY